MKPKILFTLIASLAFLFVFHQSAHAEKYPFRNYTVDDGLPSLTVWSILQDSHGYLWFGTYGGACKFDGITFTTYTTEDGLAGNGVYFIIEDREGNLWFGTGDGVSRFDGETWMTYTTENGLAHNWVWPIIEDSDGDLWFGTYGGGVSRFDGENWTTYTTGNGLAYHQVRCILEDSEGNIWFGTQQGGVSRFDGENWITYRQMEDVRIRVLSIIEDTDGNIWFGGDGTDYRGPVETWGAMVIKVTGEIESGDYTVFTDKDGLPPGGGGVDAMLEDSQGNIWFSTWGGGLVVYDGESWKVYTTENGLPSNLISSMLEDKEGNLWFGTRRSGLSRLYGMAFATFTTADGLVDNGAMPTLEDSKGNIWFSYYGGSAEGVNKYDGEKWTTYTAEDGLGGNKVSDMIKDSNGNLWFATGGGGLSKFDGKKWKTYTRKDDEAFSYVDGIYLEDKQGNLWFGGTGGRIYKFDGQKVESYLTKEAALNRNTVFAINEDRAGNFLFGTPDRLRIFNGTDWRGLEWPRKINVIFRDNQNNLWLGTDNGVIKSDIYDLFKFAGDNEEIRKERYTTENGLSHNYVLSIARDSKGNLWFGTGRGVSRYDGTGWQSFGAAEGLADSVVYAIVVDRKGNLWFGAAKGAVRFDGENWTAFNVEKGLAETSVRAIFEDERGNLWFGTGAGVTRYDGRTWKTFNTDDGLTHNDVLSIYEDSAGNLWFGTNGGGMSRFDGRDWTTHKIEGVLSADFSSSFADKRGNLWFGDWTAGLTRFDGENWSTYQTENGIIRDEVREIFEDKKGNLWFMTPNGLTFYDGESWKTYTTEDGLAHNRVRAICEDASGNLWIGTSGGGVSKFDGAGFTNYTTEDGLSSNVCDFIIEHDNYLYFGTFKGLNRFDGETFKVYTANDGLAATTVSNPLKDSKGNMWFSSANGVTKYDPRLDRHNPVPPPAYITRLRINERDTTVASGIELGYKKNNVKIDYVGLCFSSPEDVLYHYKLEGLDEDWLKTTEHSMSYPFLPPGEYTFKVQARNRDGIWSEGQAELAFEILPPFWATAWFRGSILAAFLLALWGVHVSRTRNMKNRNIELETKVKDRTKELAESNKELAHKTEELEESNIRLKELDELKSNFLSTVSHELRTPLTSIRAFSEIMIDSQEEESNPQQSHFLNIINEESQRLGRLIEDLLDISRIESGGQKWVMAHFNIKDAVEKSVTASSSLVEGKKLALQVSFPDKLPNIYGDFDTLVQVVTNLLSNAVKFTPEEGKIDIKGEVISEDNKDFVQISVSDTGEGIPEDQVEKVFEKFHQVDSTEKQKKAGTGLGLSICREIMKHHGGRIWAESELGKGSTFYFTLPVVEGK